MIKRPIASFITMSKVVDLSEVTAAMNSRHVRENSLFKDFGALLKSGAGSDVTLVVDGKRYPLHRLVLSTRCEVFERLFEHDKRAEIELYETTPRALECFVEYLYTDNCTLNLDNTVDVARLAHMYQCDVVYKCALKAFGLLLKPHCAILMWVLAKGSSLDDLVGAAEKYVLKNFFLSRSKFEHKELLLDHPELMMKLLADGKLLIRR